MVTNNLVEIRVEVSKVSVYSVLRTGVHKISNHLITREIEDQGGVYYLLLETECDVSGEFVLPVPFVIHGKGRNDLVKVRRVTVYLNLL